MLSAVREGPEGLLCVPLQLSPVQPLRAGALKALPGHSSAWKKAEERGGWRVVWGRGGGGCCVLNSPLGLLFPDTDTFLPAASVQLLNDRESAPA